MEGDLSRNDRCPVEGEASGCPEVDGAGCICSPRWLEVDVKGVNRSLLLLFFSECSVHAQWMP